MAGRFFGCSVGGQSAIDQSTDKKNPSNCSCACERACCGGGCVFDGESPAYYGRVRQNMSLLRAIVREMLVFLFFVNPGADKIKC